MCGIFAFVTKQGEHPDIARLRRIALVTQSRGAHAFGLAWLESDGQIRTLKMRGAASAHLDELDRCRRAVVLIGHCRFATHGSPADHRNNHPHPAGAGVFAHNGVIVNHLDLVDRYRLWTKTECDSETLGLLMQRVRGKIVARAAWAARQAEGDLAVVGIWRKPARLLIARRGRPLHFGEGRGGYYFASLAEGLPGRVNQVIDSTACVVSFAGGRLQFDGDRLSLERPAVEEDDGNFPQFVNQRLTPA